MQVIGDTVVKFRLPLRFGFLGSSWELAFEVALLQHRDLRGVVVAALVFTAAFRKRRLHGVFFHSLTCLVNRGGELFLGRPRRLAQHRLLCGFLRRRYMRANHLAVLIIVNCR